MWGALAIVVLGMLPGDAFVSERVDRIEVNHVFDSAGNLVLDQIIFWDWNAAKSRFDCVDWRLLRGVRREITDDQRRQWDRQQVHGTAPPPVGEWQGGHASPQPNHAQRHYVSSWYDGRSKVWRQVTAGIFLESWTAYDPELKARAILPVNQRRRLKKPAPHRGCEAKRLATPLQP